MISKDNIGRVLLSESFGFKEKSGLYTKHYGNDEDGFDLSYNIITGEFLYPDGVEADRNTTIDSHQQESFVVFLCVAQLFSQGYMPNHFKLEGVNYSGTKKGYCDILVCDNNKEEYLIIECKTADLSEKEDEFRKYWAKTMQNGGQLFRYFNTYRKARYLCMYAADYPKYQNENGEYDYRFENIYNIISLEDNNEQLKTNAKYQSFHQLRTEQGTSDDFFKVWKLTYNQDFTNRGLFEKGIEPFNIGNKNYDINDLHKIDIYTLNKKYNDFAETLRKHTVSSHENAFDKLINLFISKIIDETENRDELKLIWKGSAYDNYYSLQDRLNILYREGMQRFFNDTVTYVETKEIDDAFKFLSGKADEGKRTIHNLFRQLKYYSNNPFAFIDVHNESLFYQNSAILKDIILMLQDIYLTANEENQFLGDLFEGFLNKGVHQSEGQFFTPMPIVRFLVTSLPLEKIISDGGEIPKAIDYACGAGHFLTEYAKQIRPFVLAPYEKELESIVDANEKNIRINHIMSQYYECITGIEKDYRLSKVSQVAAYMYNMGGIKIHFADGLSKIYGVNDNYFDVLIANPPYSVRGFLDTLSDEDKQNYTLTKYVANTEKNGAIEVFFIERAAQLLKDKGVAAIILPVSILSKGNLFMEARELLVKKFDIISICSFGKKTFGQTSTNTITLFLRKKSSSPDIDFHIQNRIESWFSGDMSNDDCYDDSNILEQYTLKCGFDLDDYISLMEGNLNEGFLKSDIGEEYKRYFNLHKVIRTNPDSTGMAEKARLIRDEAQKYVQKPIYKNLDDDSKSKIDRELLTKFIREIEKEKLYYFMLASNNPKPVLVIKAPESTTAEKAFLGYYFSTRKGNEGIKYNNVVDTRTKGSSDDEIEDDTINQLKGIDGIQTPMFNPVNLEDETRINTLIRKNYNSEDIIIPDDLSEMVQIYSLEDLFDFSNATFNKAIKLTPPLNYPQLETKYEVDKIKNVAPYVTDKIEYENIQSKSYISTVNMLPNRGGVLEYEGDPVHEKVTLFKKDDILVSNIRPYLKKIWYAEYDGGCSNDVIVFRNTKQSDYYSKYIFEVLSTDIFFDYMMVGKTGIKMPRGDKKVIPNFLIPKAPKNIQDKIINECADIEKDQKKYNIELENSINNIRVIVNSLKGVKRRISDTCDINTNTINPKEYPNKEFVYVDIDAVENGTGIISWDKKIKGFNSPSRARRIAFKGSTLISTVRPNLRGFAFVEIDKNDAVFSTGFAVLKSKDISLLDDKMIYFQFMYSDFMMKQMVDAMPQGSYPSINRADIDSFNIITCIEDQDKILRNLNNLENKVIDLNNKLAHIFKLKQNVIDKYLK
jgi:type I restriction-modification system DNA methylase subunit